jgi:hypothetical protein
MSEVKDQLGGSLEDEPKSDNPGFFKYVFNFDDDNKSQILNILQYAGLAIIPTIIILKLTKNIIPEEDENKGSLEILAESVGQLIFILLLIWLSNKIISFIPTYSKVAYPDYNIISSLLPWLIVIFTMQTKLGHKINILVERLSDIWEGKTSLRGEKKEALKVRQPFSGQHQPSQADTLGNQMGVPPMLGLNTGTTSVSSLPTVQSPDFNNMYQGPQNPLENAATPQMGPQEPMAANEAFGGMFGGF